MSDKALTVVKRNGQVVPYDLKKIEAAIGKAYAACKESLDSESGKALVQIQARVLKEKVLSVEIIQDIVEEELMVANHKVAKAYILYRREHEELRAAALKTALEVSSAASATAASATAASFTAGSATNSSEAPSGKMSEKKEEKAPEWASSIKENMSFFNNDPYRYFIYLRTYAKWLDNLKRRETWTETVDRYMEYMDKRLSARKASLEQSDRKEIREAILKMEVMPSMRLLQFAGTCVDRNDLYAYNCSFGTPQSFSDLRDAMYILMCGTGYGFSVEKIHVDKFPEVSAQAVPTLGAIACEVKEDKAIKLKAWKKAFGLSPVGSCHISGEPISLLNFAVAEYDKELKPVSFLSAPYSEKPSWIIDDTKEAWCDALLFGLRAWAMGRDVNFDYSRIRKAGARLKGTGGRASGPQPLKDLLDFAKERMLSRQGSRLRTLDVHDLMCKIGQIVVAGNVRRSALISLSDLSDEELRKSKSGSFWATDSQRFMANNSAVYLKKPSDEEFMEEWLSLIKSRSGERGIFNRGSISKSLPERRVKHLGDKVKYMGTNPCGEIFLQPSGLCNLSTIVCRPEDTEASLLRKIRLASILGTYQATLTNIGYVSKAYKENAESERLLGVSMTGQFDCPLVRKPEMLAKLKAKAVEVNASYAKQFGISPSMAVTAVKPEGTVSEMVGAASGMHARFSQYYIRRVRINAADPLCQMMKDQGIKWNPENGQSEGNHNTAVFEFPVQAPKESITRDEVKALDMLEYWRLLKTEYCEHNPSVTVDVGADEWIDCQQWVMKNWALVGGISFLPRSDHIYQLAPFEKISKEQYDKLDKTACDFSKLVYYEKDDSTDRKGELACAGKDGCSL